jgi:hypothetical protein
VLGDPRLCDCRNAPFAEENGPIRARRRVGRRPSAPIPAQEPQGAVRVMWEGPRHFFLEVMPITRAIQRCELYIYVPPVEKQPGLANFTEQVDALAAAEFEAALRFMVGAIKTIRQLRPDLLPPRPVASQPPSRWRRGPIYPLAACCHAVYCAPCVVLPHAVNLHNCNTQRHQSTTSMSRHVFPSSPRRISSDVEGCGAIGLASVV